MTIYATTMVSAAHHLGELHDARHRNSTMHGHTYIVKVYVKEQKDWLSAELLKERLDTWTRLVDHKVLNDVLAPNPPTMEALARWFADAAASEFEVIQVSIDRPEGLGCLYTVDV